MWKFKQKARDDMNEDPHGEEHFAAEATTSVGLVREFIQNAIDARINSAPLKVRFAFSGPDNSLAPQIANRYLSSLKCHLESCPLITLPDWNSKMSFLVIEDFGTKGLCGDPEQHEDISSNEKNDFYYFWRNIGRSQKSERDLGRWGLGKAVFSLASSIRSYFGLTVRADDNRHMLMGLSLPGSHQLDRKTYKYYGYYGSFQEDQKDCFAFPVEDKGKIDLFCKHFLLQRARKPGLSVIIPYLDAEIEAEAIVRAAILHFFCAILNGSLTVEVDSHKKCIIDKSTVREVSASIDWEQDGLSRDNITRLLDFAEWAINHPERDFASIDYINKTPKWDENLFEPKLLEDLRERYQHRKRIAIEVPVVIKRKGTSACDTQFHLFLERDKKLDSAETYFIRNGIRIPDVKPRVKNEIRGMVLVEDDLLTTFLGDCENPAHRKWSEGFTNFKHRYENGRACLNFIKASLSEVVKILSGPQEGRDKEFFGDIFSIPLPPDVEPEDIGETPGTGGGGGGSKEPVISFESRKSLIQMTRIKAGFSISSRDQEDIIGKTVLVKVAYQIRRGNAFKRYQPVDFEMDRNPVNIEADGVEVTKRRLNNLEFRVLDEDFGVTVTGFDVRRDLKIKAEVEDEA